MSCLRIQRVSHQKLIPGGPWLPHWTTQNETVASYQVSEIECSTLNFIIKYILCENTKKVKILWDEDIILSPI